MMEKMLRKYIKNNYIKPQKDKSIWTRLFKLVKRDKLNNKMSCGDIENSCKKNLSKVNFDFENNLQETFVQHLFNIIDQKNLKDSDVYKKANIDRKLFSKIRSNVNYKPSKNTVISFAIALELSLKETQSLLATVGFTLSKSSKFDIIIEYFLLKEEYDIFTINETLFKFDQVCLGT